MSIFQEYESLKKEIGAKKYNAIDKYIQKYGKSKKWHKEIKKIQSIKDINEWEKENKRIHQMCKPIFIEDVVQDEKEWQKFESWYKTYCKNKNRER